MHRVPKILVLLAVASLMLSGSVAGQLGAEIRGPVGPSPYEVVRGWHKPFAQTGYAFGGNSGVFCGVPDRIFVAMRAKLGFLHYPPGLPGLRRVGRHQCPFEAGRRTWRHCLYTLDRDGRVLEMWDQWDHLCRDSDGPGPHRIRISPYDPDSRVWVINETFHEIHVFSNDGSRLLFTLGEKGVPGNDQTHFARPQDVAFLPDGRILVADGLDNHRVMILDEDMDYLGEFGGNGDAPGQFNGIHAIAVGPGGRIFLIARVGSTFSDHK